MWNKFLIFIFLLLSFAVASGQNSRTFLFVGSYTDGKPDKGIYVYDFNPETGRLREVTTAQDCTNPAFLTLSVDGKFLYACTETQLPDAGSISAFSFNREAQKLTFINKQSSGGANPAYVTVSNTNKWVIAANYTGGSVVVLNTNEDGSLNPYSQLIPFSGSSINTARQDRSHVHSTVFSPDYDFLFVSDLGLDKISVFSFNPDIAQPLTAVERFTIHTVPGSGPRHFTFAPNHKFAYGIEELGGYVSGYRYNAGRLEPFQRIFAYSKTQEEYGSADIHISPDGRFLYASNRKDAENTLAIFSIDPQNGQLTFISHQSTFGDHPRNFTLDPTGNFLLVANQFTNNVVVFKRDARTGLLTRTETELNIPNPSCLVMRTYP